MSNKAKINCQRNLLSSVLGAEGSTASEWEFIILAKVRADNVMFVKYCLQPIMTVLHSKYVDCYFAEGENKGYVLAFVSCLLSFCRFRHISVCFFFYIVCCRSLLKCSTIHVFFTFYGTVPVY